MNDSELSGEVKDTPNNYRIVLQGKNASPQQQEQFREDQQRHKTDRSTLSSVDGMERQVIGDRMDGSFESAQSQKIVNEGITDKENERRITEYNRNNEMKSESDRSEDELNLNINNLNDNINVNRKLHNVVKQKQNIEGYLHLGRDQFESNIHDDEIVFKDEQNQYEEDNQFEQIHRYNYESQLRQPNHDKQQQQVQQENYNIQSISNNSNNNNNNCNNNNNNNNNDASFKSEEQKCNANNNNNFNYQQHSQQQEDQRLERDEYYSSDENMYQQQQQLQQQIPNNNDNIGYGDTVSSDQCGYPCQLCNDIPVNYVALSCEHNFCLDCLLSEDLQLHEQQCFLPCALCGALTKLDEQSQSALQTRINEIKASQLDSNNFNLNSNINAHNRQMMIHDINSDVIREEESTETLLTNETGKNTNRHLTKLNSFQKKINDADELLKQQQYQFKEKQQLIASGSNSKNNNSNSSKNNFREFKNSSQKDYHQHQFEQHQQIQLQQQYQESVSQFLFKERNEGEIYNSSIMQNKQNKQIAHIKKLLGETAFHKSERENKVSQSNNFESSSQNKEEITNLSSAGKNNQFNSRITHQEQTQNQQISAYSNSPYQNNNVHNQVISSDYYSSPSPLYKSNEPLSIIQAPDLQQQFQHNSNSSDNKSCESDKVDALRSSCEGHPLEEGVLFCFDCECRCFCLKCYDNKHKYHNVVDVNECSDVMRDRLKQTIQQIDNKVLMINKVIKTIHHNQTTLQQNSSFHINELSQLFEDHISKLVNKMKQLQYDMAAITTQTQTYIDLECNQLQEAKLTLQTINNKLLILQIQEQEQDFSQEFQQENSEHKSGNLNNPLLLKQDSHNSSNTKQQKAMQLNYFAECKRILKEIIDRTVVSRSSTDLNSNINLTNAQLSSVKDSLIRSYDITQQINFYNIQQNQLQQINLIPQQLNPSLPLKHQNLNSFNSKLINGTEYQFKPNVLFNSNSKQYNSINIQDEQIDSKKVNSLPDNILKDIFSSVKKQNEPEESRGKINQENCQNLLDKMISSKLEINHWDDNVNKVQHSQQRQERELSAMNNSKKLQQENEQQDKYEQTKANKPNGVPLTGSGRISKYKNQQAKEITEGMSKTTQQQQCKNNYGSQHNSNTTYFSSPFESNQKEKLQQLAQQIETINTDHKNHSSSTNRYTEILESGGRSSRDTQRASLEKEIEKISSNLCELQANIVLNSELCQKQETSPPKFKNQMSATTGFNKQIKNSSSMKNIINYSNSLSNLKVLQDKHPGKNSSSKKMLEHLKKQQLSSSTGFQKLFSAIQKSNQLIIKTNQTISSGNNYQIDKNRRITEDIKQSPKKLFASSQSTTYSSVNSVQPPKKHLKRNEHPLLISKNSSLLSISIPVNDPTLQLMKEQRNAHRQMMSEFRLSTQTYCQTDPLNSSIGGGVLSKMRTDRTEPSAERQSVLSELEGFQKEREALYSHHLRAKTTIQSVKSLLPSQFSQNIQTSPSYLQTSPFSHQSCSSLFGNSQGNAKIHNDYSPLRVAQSQQQARQQYKHKHSLSQNSLSPQSSYFSKAAVASHHHNIHQNLDNQFKSSSSQQSRNLPNAFERQSSQIDLLANNHNNNKLSSLSALSQQQSFFCQFRK